MDVAAPSPAAPLEPQMRNPRPLITAGLALALMLGFLPAFSSGPFGGLTGAPGDQTCTLCHGDFAVNAGIAAGIATFDITAPETTVGLAGNLPIGVSFPTTSARIHGFQATVRDATDSPLLQSWAGDMVVTDPVNTQNAFGDPFYITHTTSGNVQTSWSMEMAPRLGLPAGPLTIYAAGNAANRNFNTTGDYIFNSSKIVYQARTSSASNLWATGAVHNINIEAPNQGNSAYALAISDDATPVSVGPFAVPLNPFTLITDFAWNTPSIFTNFIGFTDAAGNATATVNLPPVPGLAGAQFHFAFVTFDAAALPAFVPTEVSNRMTITIQ